MHIILNSLRYALWLVFCLFRHAVFVPAAFGGVYLLARLVFGHPVSDLNDQLQKEATAWRTAPPGHYMWEECPVPDNAAPPEAKPAACTVTPSPQKPRRTITCCHCGPYGSFFHPVECSVCALALTGGCPALPLPFLQGSRCREGNVYPYGRR